MRTFQSEGNWSSCGSGLAAHVVGEWGGGPTTALRPDFLGPCSEKGCELESGASWGSLWLLWGARRPLRRLDKSLRRKMMER